MMANFGTNITSRPHKNVGSDVPTSVMIRKLVTGVQNTPFHLDRPQSSKSCVRLKRPIAIGSTVMTSSGDPGEPGLPLCHPATGVQPAGRPPLPQGPNPLYMNGTPRHGRTPTFESGDFRYKPRPYVYAYVFLYLKATSATAFGCTYLDSRYVSALSFGFYQ